MADHVRAQIRQRVTDALAAVPLFEGRVYQTRVYPLQRENLPGVIVYAINERSERDNSPTDSMRDLTIAVQCVVAFALDLDLYLDAMAAEVEKAIDALGEMDGLAKIYGGIQETAFSYTGAENEVPHAAIAMEFLYTYRTRAGAPDVAI